MEMIAHRGASYHAPENSLAAFEEAIRRGADRLECDLHITRDGIPVVCHDPTTKRTTDLDLDIATSTLDELRAARMPNGEAIPTFDELCALTKGRATLDVEVKASSELLSELCVRVLQRHAMVEETIITSFDAEVLTAVRRHGFDARTGLLIGSRSLSPLQRAYEAWPLKRMEAAGANLLAIHVALAHSWLRKALRKRGYGLLLWAAMEDEEKRVDERAALYVRMRLAAPDGVIVGRVREARAIIEASALAATDEPIDPRDEDAPVDG
jgi:glycerophosphoryl diester phosphodiesterase